MSWLLSQLPIVGRPLSQQRTWHRPAGCPATIYVESWTGLTPSISSLSEVARWEGCTGCDQPPYARRFTNLRRLPSMWTIQKTIPLVPAAQLHRFIAAMLEDNPDARGIVAHQAGSGDLELERVAACLQGLRLADFRELAKGLERGRRAARCSTRYPPNAVRYGNAGRQACGFSFQMIFRRPLGPLSPFPGGTPATDCSRLPDETPSPDF